MIEVGISKRGRGNQKLTSERITYRYLAATWLRGIEKGLRNDSRPRAVTSNSSTAPRRKADIRFWSKRTLRSLADIAFAPLHVRFRGKADMIFLRECLLLTQSGHLKIPVRMANGEYLPSLSKNSSP